MVSVQVTHYEILAEGNGYSLARLWLETGPRDPSIRVHMSYLGYPLAGDTWYGGNTKMIGRQALHCFRCHFLHPISGERIELSAPLCRIIQKGNGKCIYKRKYWIKMNNISKNA